MIPYLLAAIGGYIIGQSQKDTFGEGGWVTSTDEAKEIVVKHGAGFITDVKKSNREGFSWYLPNSDYGGTDENQKYGTHVTDEQLLALANKLIKWPQGPYMTKSDYNRGELSKYLQNIRPDPFYGEGSYKADFGRNGGITWEIPESQRELESPGYLIVQSMDRNKNSGVANREDSKGEGSKAIASLFQKYDSVKEILYDDYAESGFWQKIGGDEQTLKREDFFMYFNNKFDTKLK